MGAVSNIYHYYRDCENLGSIYFLKNEGGPIVHIKLCSKTILFTQASVPFSQPWDTANAELDVPSVENLELWEVLSFQLGVG